MKNILFVSLILMTFFAHAEGKIVPLDMELGYWESQAEIGESEMITNMLAGMPESQREQVRAMMLSKMEIPVVKQCVTEETLQDMDKQLQEAFSDANSQHDCEFEVVQSSSQEFVGKLICEGNVTNIHTKVINSKRNESKVVSSLDGMGTTNITAVGEWKSATCPEGI